MFSDGAVWTRDNAQALIKYFVDSPDETDRSFDEKLQDQLAAAPASAKHLAAEITWVMYLCPSNITASHKRERINRLWDWAAQGSIDPNSKYLSDEVLRGIGSAGPGYNQHQWRETCFAFRFVHEWIMVPPDKRKEMLADGWRFAEWLERIPECNQRQFRHMLMFLLFPDSFERTFGGNQRRMIVDHFDPLTRAQVRKLSALKLDRKLAEIRQQLEIKHGTKELDFYAEPVHSEWAPEDELAEGDANEDPGDAETADPTASHAVAEESAPYGVEGRNTPFSLADLSAESGFAEPLLAKWLGQLRRKKHFVFQGPPGTGKTYLAQRLAKVLMSGSRGIVDMVQFHPAYSYEDFIQGIRPEVVQGQMAFKLVPGRFLEFCQRAAALPGEPCVLIIDELNRANLSRVFGELMYLLEYRDRAIPLAGGGAQFSVPDNVYVVGTMNTADRSIALVDHALRRRFTFAFLEPAYDVLQRQLVRQGIDVSAVNSLVQTLQSINTEVIKDRHYQLGISFFLTDGNMLPQRLQAIWEGEIEPYLEEYLLDQSDHGAAPDWTWAKLVDGKLAPWR
ncbi:MAG: AAA family ATPase [Proteobacteria bacterium]|nr:AAA family ATPase [Pseudomonadota bacterium]